MLKKLRRKVYRKIRFQTWYRKAYYYHRKRRDLDKTIAQYRGVDVLSDKKRLYRLRRDMIRSLFRRNTHLQKSLFIILRFICRIFQIQSLVGKMPEVFIFGIVCLA